MDECTLSQGGEVFQKVVNQPAGSRRSVPYGAGSHGDCYDIYPGHVYKWFLISHRAGLSSLPSLWQGWSGVFNRVYSARGVTRL